MIMTSYLKVNLKRYFKLNPLVVTGIFSIWTEGFIGPDQRDHIIFITSSVFQLLQPLSAKFCSKVITVPKIWQYSFSSLYNVQQMSFLHMKTTLTKLYFVSLNQAIQYFINSRQDSIIYSKCDSIALEVGSLHTSNLLISKSMHIRSQQTPICFECQLHNNLSEKPRQKGKEISLP